MSDFCCPLCLKNAKAQKAKPLYGTKVCKKCYSGLVYRRQFAYFIDTLVWLPISFGVTVGVGILMSGGSIQSNLNGLGGHLSAFMSNSVLGVQSNLGVSVRAGAGASWGHGMLLFVFNFFLGFIFLPMIFGFKDGFAGKSLGKLICGVEVVDMNTRQPIGFAQAFKRNLVLLVPLVPTVIALTLRKGQRFGDKWANTKVILRKARNHAIFTGALACEGCQYDLRGNTSDQCPECGRPVSVDNLNKLTEAFKERIEPQNRVYTHRQ